MPPFNQIGPDGRKWRRRILKRLAYDFGWSFDDLVNETPWPSRTVEKDLRALGIVKKSTKDNSLWVRYLRLKQMGWSPERIAKHLRIPEESLENLGRPLG